MYRFIVDDAGRFYYELIGSKWIKYTGIFFCNDFGLRCVTNDYDIQYVNVDTDHIISEEDYV